MRTLSPSATIAPGSFANMNGFQRVSFEARSQMPVALVVPAGYFAVVYANLDHDLSFAAHGKASRLASFIADNGENWQRPADRLSQGVARPGADGRLLVDELPLAGLRVQGKAAHPAARLTLTTAHLADCEQVGALWVDGEEGRVGRFRRQLGGGELAGGDVQLGPVETADVVRLKDLRVEHAVRQPGVFRTKPSSFPSGSAIVNLRVPYGVSKSGYLFSLASSVIGVAHPNNDVCGAAMETAFYATALAITPPLSSRTTPSIEAPTCACARSAPAHTDATVRRTNTNCL